MKPVCRASCVCVRSWRWWRWWARESPVTRCTATVSGSSSKGSRWSSPGSLKRDQPGGGATRRADGKPDPGAASVLVSRRKAYWPDAVRQRNIGSRWLELFAREQTTLSARTGFEFILAGVVDSKRSLLNYDGLDASRALAFFNDEAVEQDEESLFLWMRAHPYDDLVVLDVTASEQLADQYLDFASHGFHVISANKLAGASSSDKYRQIHDAFEKTGRHWLYNATVGAGLPVNHTVRDLIDSGDTILGLSGIFSGTLSWLFLQFDGTVPFTDLVDQAWQQGLTEPDPRVDLSGKDVMRKLVILAREAGYDIEPDQVRVESLVPAHCEEGSVDHFFENGEELNEQMLQRLEAAREMGLVLRYVARFDANGKARVGVEAVREEHPLAALLPCDNVFAIESRWYRDNPLVIRGPGAGRDVTAGAIQSDINRLAQLL